MHEKRSQYRKGTNNIEFNMTNIAHPFRRKRKMETYSMYLLAS